MSELTAIGRGFGALLLYVWAAAFIWHLLPDEPAWWLIPAILTTAFLGLASLVGGMIFGFWLTEEK